MVRYGMEFTDRRISGGGVWHIIVIQYNNIIVQYYCLF